MAYSSVANILSVLPELPQTSTASGYSATTVLIASHITRSDNIINAKISQRYDVSAFVTNTPPFLISLSEDIASYYTYRSLYSSDNQNFNDWTDKFKDAIAILDEIRNGNMDLVNSSGSVIADRTETPFVTVDSNTKDYQPFFDEDDVLDWDIDAEKKSDISGNR